MLSQTRLPGITFSVDDVTPAEQPIFCEPLQEHLDWRFQRKVLALSDAGQLVTQPNGKRLHPLIETVHEAFAQHRPVCFSPDSIWMVIAQGFGHHVAANAEALRGRLVRHQGKEELSVQVTDLTVASFESAIEGFSSQIRGRTDPVIHETLVANFSTTTTAERVASQVALMDCYSSYFTYALHCVCGIPRITLTGTVEDWQRIRARIEVLATFDLEWWISRLRPTLDEFVLAVSGRPTRSFWQAIYKPVKFYAATMPTGWITDLFPYLGDPPERRRNPVFRYAREEWGLPASTSGLVSHAEFPSGLSSVPVKVVAHGSSRTLDLVAGFFGIRQDPADLTLMPLIGWSVAEPAPAKPILI